MASVKTALVIGGGIGAPSPRWPCAKRVSTRPSTRRMANPPTGRAVR